MPIYRIDKSALTKNEDATAQAARLSFFADTGAPLAGTPPAADPEKAKQEAMLVANAGRAKSELEALAKALILPIPLLLGLAAALMSRAKALVFETGTLPLDAAQVLVTVAVALALLQCGRLAVGLVLVLDASNMEQDKEKPIDAHATVKDALTGNAASLNPFADYIRKNISGGEVNHPAAKAGRLNHVPTVGCALLLSVPVAFLIVRLVLQWREELPKWEGQLVYGYAVAAAVAVGLSAVGACYAAWRIGTVFEVLQQKEKWKIHWAGFVIGVGLGVAIAIFVTTERRDALANQPPQTVFECTFTPTTAPACTPKPTPSR